MLPSRNSSISHFATTAPLLCTSGRRLPTNCERDPLPSCCSFRRRGYLETDGSRWNSPGRHYRPIKKGAVPKYTTRRSEVGGYRPWPNGLYRHQHEGDSGVVVFDRMFPCGPATSAYPLLQRAIRLTIEDSRISRIEAVMRRTRYVDFWLPWFSTWVRGLWFKEIHCGVHPRQSRAASVSESYPPSHDRTWPRLQHSLPHRRTTSHRSLPYWMHCTGTSERQRGRWVTHCSMTRDIWQHLTILKCSPWLPSIRIDRTLPEPWSY